MSIKNSPCTRIHQGIVVALLVIVGWPIPGDAQTGQITHVHDPCIIKCEEYYYIFSTSDGIAIRRSASLSSWQFIGEVFDEIPDWGKQEIPGVRNIWAPDIYYHEGIYYLYYSLSTFGSNRSCIGLATNTTLDPNDPQYTWIDRGKVFESYRSDNYNAIDPNILMDAQGKIWMSFGSFWSGLKLVELNPDTWKPPENRRLYSIAGRSGGAIEAPFMISKNGYYYLFVSFDFCCRGVDSNYKIMVGRSENITGPFTDKYKRTLLNGGGHLVLAGDDRWRGTGHCAVLQEENADWLVYHAYDAQANGTPTLRIKQIYWDSEDWPVLNKPSPVDEESTLKTGETILYQNYPNPMNSSTTMAFELDDQYHVKLTIHTVLGQTLLTLINEPLPKGRYKVPIQTGTLSSGVYYYSLQSDSFTETRKMVVLE